MTAFQMFVGWIVVSPWIVVSVVVIPIIKDMIRGNVEEDENEC